jgi:hypothetical protein
MDQGMIFDVEEARGLQLLMQVLLNKKIIAFPV